MSSNRSADWQPNPQQETLGDRLSHFGSSSIDRVDHRSAYDWKGRASSDRPKTRIISVRVLFMLVAPIGVITAIAAMQHA